MSDNDRLVFGPGPVLTSQQFPIEIVVEAVSPYSTATGISFNAEAHCSGANITQAISLFNFETQSYDLLSNSNPDTTDTITVVTVASNFERYLGPAGEMRAKLAYRALGPVLVYPWRARIDHTFWTISP